MIKPLIYPRRYVYRTSRLAGQTLIEGVICYVPDFTYKYHVFLIENGIERKKGYCKSYSVAERMLERFFKRGALKEGNDGRSESRPVRGVFGSP